MVYGDDFGLNEAGVATVLFQSPIENAGQTQVRQEEDGTFLFQKVANWETDKAVT